MTGKTTGPALLAAGLLAWTALAPVAAWASADDDDDSDGGAELEPDDVGDEVELEPEPEPANTPEGANENPDAPPEFGTRTGARDAAVPPVRTGYPIERTLRPITLAAGMSEVRLDVLGNVNPFFVTGPLQAHYGVTRQIQIGLSYGPGAVNSDGFTTGKAVGVEGYYLLFDWLAVQGRIPVLLDPFAIGVTIGAPFKFRFGEKLALIGGHDLINIKLFRFVPTVGNSFDNAQFVADDMSNTIQSRGALRMLGGVIYQIDPQLAFLGEIGVLAENFALTDAGVPLLATVTYSTSNMFDVGVRVGFRNLDNATENFGATLLLALRI